MVDGVHFGEHTCVVALGIGIDGVKHPPSVEEGSMLEAGRQFRRVNGHLNLPRLRAALEARFAENVAA